VRRKREKPWGSILLCTSAQRVNSISLALVRVYPSESLLCLSLSPVSELLPCQPPHPITPISPVDTLCRLALTIGDFDLLRRIGDGSFSHVVLARRRATGLEYALKVIDKHYITRHNMVGYIQNERLLLDRLDNEGIAKLCFTFQDAMSLYLGLELCVGGECRGACPSSIPRYAATQHGRHATSAPFELGLPGVLFIHADSPVLQFYSVDLAHCMQAASMQVSCTIRSA
jgi:serine/threonine protein kinase